MKNKKPVMQVALPAFLFCASALFSQTDPISLRGTIVDQYEKPVVGAAVSLYRANISDTTDSQGRFHLSNASLGLKQPRQNADAAMRNGILHFRLLEPGKVVVDLIDLQGRSLTTPFHLNLKAGEYELNPAYGLNLPGPALVRLQRGGFSSTFLFMNSGRKNFLFRTAVDAKNTPLAKTASAVDTLTVTVEDGNEDMTLVVREINQYVDTLPDLRVLLLRRPVVTPPPSPTSNTKPTWTWQSAGGSGIFRYNLDRFDSTLTAGAVETQALSFTPDSALAQGNHWLCVWEQHLGQYWSMPGCAPVLVVDSSRPFPPRVTTSYSTSDPRPIWTWQSGGGGNGVFRYKVNDSNLVSGAVETTDTSYTAPEPLVNGSYTLYVQEKNDAGNWSPSGEATTWVSVTRPPRPVVTGPPSPTDNTRPTWTWVSGGGSGSGVFRYNLNRSDSTLAGGAAETQALSFTPDSPLTQGNHWLCVWESDSIGNLSFSDCASVVVDDARP